MDAYAIRRHIEGAFPDVDVTTNDWGTFFLVRPDEKFPFATIVDKDDPYDNFSNLDRPGVFRLNIGVGLAHKHGVPLFGLLPAWHRYFDYHHSERDTIDAVNERELQMGAVAVAYLAWALAE